MLYMYVMLYNIIAYYTIKHHNHCNLQLQTISNADTIIYNTEIKFIEVCIVQINILNNCKLHKLQLIIV